MIEQQFLFELPPNEYIPFRDTYYLKGKEKQVLLEEMVKFTVDYQKIENPTQTDKRHYFYACTYLEADAIRQEKRVHLASIMYKKMRGTLVTAELDKFKINIKLRFIEKYQKEMESGQITTQMSKDLDKITKMEKSACYMITGIDVEMRDCDTCKHKICQRKPKTEEEWTDLKEKKEA